MKAKKKTTSFLFAIGTVLIAVALESCGNKDEKKQQLVVEKQHVEIQAADTTDSNNRLVFDVDVPVSGSQVLVDSVMTLLNEQLYQTCEYILAIYDIEPQGNRFAFDSIKANDAAALIKHYSDQYGPLIEKELGNYFEFDMGVIAQTETFVTYALEFTHCGGTCGSEYYCYTFDKQDGHQVHQFITQENFSKLLTDYPAYQATLDSIQPLYDENNRTGERTYALLDNSLLIVVNGVYNQYNTIEIPYKDSRSYLSEEAQALVGEVEKENSTH